MSQLPPDASDPGLDPGNEELMGTEGTVDITCPRCNGSGQVGGEECPLCEGVGRLPEDDTP